MEHLEAFHIHVHQSGVITEAKIPTMTESSLTIGDYMLIK